MTKYRLLLFDLDGTLSDPKLGITRSVQYALHKMGVEENNLEKLISFIGPPLQETFTEQYHFSEEQTKLAIDFYRERFKTVGMFENDLYPGIVEMLKAFKSRSCKLAVATSKPTVFAEEILKYFQIDMYFDIVVGSYLDGTRASKTEIIEAVLEAFPTYTKSEIIMIGDRKHDIIGANNVGIDSIGVTFGYGSEEELIYAGPTYMVHSVNEIMELLENDKQQECRK